MPRYSNLVFGTYKKARYQCKRTLSITTLSKSIGGPGGIAGFALLRCGVLETSFCARPRYAEPTTTIFPLENLCRGFKIVLSHTNKKAPSVAWDSFIGGPGGIRTHDTWLKRPLL